MQAAPVEEFAEFVHHMRMYVNVLNYVVVH